MYYKGEKLATPVGAGTDFHGFGNDIRKTLLAHMPTIEDVSLLDIGTGLGQNVAFLAELPVRKQIVTIDLSIETLKNAKNVLSERRLDSDVAMVRGSVENLPFRKGCFDAVITVMLLHHMRDIQIGFHEMARVAKESGKLLITDYKPEAHVLSFNSRHDESDFFDSEKVCQGIQRAGLVPNVENFLMWYFVEAHRRKA